MWGPVGGTGTARVHRDPPAEVTDSVPDAPNPCFKKQQEQNKTGWWVAAAAPSAACPQVVQDTRSRTAVLQHTLHCSGASEAAVAASEAAQGAANGHTARNKVRPGGRRGAVVGVFHTAFTALRAPTGRMLRAADR